MSLLAEIQSSLLDDKSAIGPILLKLRFLASRLGVPILEEWVKHEIEGYPDEAPVPEYREVGITYTGTFQNMHQVVHDIPVSNILISKYAGRNWVTIGIRNSIAVVDDRIARKGEKGGMFAINTGNLSLLLQGKIYGKDVAVVQIVGKFDISAFVTIQAAVRAKVLDLTLEIEKAVPAAADIVVGVKPAPLTPSEAEKVAQVAQNVFYGPVTQVSNSGTLRPIIINSVVGDTGQLIKALAGAGVSDVEAKELAKIVQAETPEGTDGPVGKGAKSWLASKMKAAAGVGGKIVTPVAIDLIEAAIKGYYGT
jgi:AbiTii